MNIQKLRVVHLDYYIIMLDVVSGLLKGTDITIVEQSSDFGEAEKILWKRPADILLLGLNNAAELRHEFTRELDLLAKARLLFPDLRIIVYSMNNYADDIAEIMNRGANWYLGNSITKENLIEAINSVKSRQRYLSTAYYSLFKNPEDYFSRFSNKLIPKDSLFSSREIEILRYIASGYSSKEISEALNITPKTVETHRKNLVKKAKVKNTPELMFFSYQHGFL